MKELKARCGGFAAIEQKLKKMDAHKASEGKESATYFDTEGRGALKIVQEEKGARMGLAAYNEETGCFDIVSTPIGDVNGARRIFMRLFSSVARMDLEKKVYGLGEFVVLLVHINQLGNFVLIRSGSASEEKLHGLLGELGIEPDKVVEKDFGQLLTHSEERI